MSAAPDDWQYEHGMDRLVDELHNGDGLPLADREPLREAVARHDAEHMEQFEEEIELLDERLAQLQGTPIGELLLIRLRAIRDGDLP